MPWTYEPGPEFFAACRAIVGADSPAVVDMVRKIAPLRQDVEKIEADIIVAQRTIRLPLDPPPGTLEPEPFMMATLQAIAELRLDDAAIRGRCAGE